MINEQDEARAVEEFSEWLHENSLANREEPKEKKEIQVELYNKYLLTIEEASMYFGIGQSKLRNMLSTDPYNTYTLKNGRKTLIKRVVFEQYLNAASSI